MNDWVELFVELFVLRKKDLLFAICNLPITIE